MERTRAGRDSLARRWERFVATNGHPLDGLRPEVAGSWGRSLREGAHRRTEAPADDPSPEWRHSPLGRAVTALRDELHRVADDGQVIVAVTDQDTRIMWTASSVTMRRRAERLNFAPGGRWDEASIGTNALDLAWRTRGPATVWSAEHFNPNVQDWVCYAVPVPDPHTGEQLGVLDLSTTWDRDQSLGLPTARALGRLLASAVAATPREPQPPEAPLSVRLLGRPEVRIGERRIALTPRQAEIVALLALAPDGLTAGELHARVYGDATVSRATLKAEVSHLRRLLGRRIASRPYRLLGEVRCDVTELLDAVRRGDVRGAAARYTGALLPGTESPELAQWAEFVTVSVREGLLRRPDPDAALRWSEEHPEDTGVLLAALRTLPEHDPRAALLRARLAAADA
ncbi:transcriptional regulator [Gandjariella thermophila]|uniref:Transcriptional regulator n=1 Tax=Gandjariella thermophila TaxID=1931992 RepID=A0A4D4J5W3_9PSEU|nr:transcriptional regulator [Gandjariella thermophila]GDY31941.1 transcriptional regulator [Gandjariella thermophila]